MELVLGRRFTEKAWETVSYEHGEDLELGVLTHEEVAARVRAIGSMFQPANRRVPTSAAPARPIPGVDILRKRARAISAWVARGAAAQPSVEAFRHRHLGGAPIGEGEVGGWVRETYAHTLPGGWPDMGSPETGWAHAMAAHLIRNSREEHVLLEWAERDAEGRWVSGRWPVPPRSVLAELASVGQKLEQQWHWSRAEATLFVLTGFQPNVPPIRGWATAGFNYSEAMGGRYDVMSRVAIELDPTVTPEQLAAWWRPVRKRMFDDKRHRSLTDRHLELARFMAGRPDDTSWEQDRLVWNRAVPERWQYDDRRNFRRDAVLAVERILEVGISSASISLPGETG